MADELTRDEDRIRAWREWAKADAERRGLPELARLIDGLSNTLSQLRAGDWNPEAGLGTATGGDR
jgi:hypothetical protein